MKKIIIIFLLPLCSFSKDLDSTLNLLRFNKTMQKTINTPIKLIAKDKWLFDFKRNLQVDYNIQLKTLKLKKNEADKAIAQDLEILNEPSDYFNRQCQAHNSNRIFNLNEEVYQNSRFEFIGKKPTCRTTKCWFNSSKLIRLYNCYIVLNKDSHTIHVNKYTNNFGQGVQAINACKETSKTLSTLFPNIGFYFEIELFFPRTGGVFDPVPAEFKCHLYTISKDDN